MDNKKKKRYRKEIEILKRTDIEQLRRKITEFLTKLYEQNGQEEYALELQTTVYNLINYFAGKGTGVPAPLHKLCIQLTDSYVADGNLKRAEDVLRTVIMGDMSESEELDLIRGAIRKLEAAKFEVGQQDIRTIVDEAQALESKLGVESSFSEMDIVRACSKEIEFEPFLKLFASQRHEPLKIIDGDPISGTKGRTNYAGTVYPEMRIRFIDDTFRDENGNKKYTLRVGQGRFSEYIIIEIKGENSSIWEQFYERTKDGSLRVAQEKATYIIPNDRAVELMQQQKAKSEIREIHEADSRIQWLNHITNKNERENGLEIVDGRINWDSGSYYSRFKQKFNESVGHKYFDVKPLTRRGKPTITGIRKGKVQKPEVEDVVAPTDIVIQEDNPQGIPELSSKEQQQKNLENLLDQLCEITTRYNEARRTGKELKEIEEELSRKIKEVELFIGERGE